MGIKFLSQNKNRPFQIYFSHESTRLNKVTSYALEGKHAFTNPLVYLKPMLSLQPL